MIATKMIRPAPVEIVPEPVLEVVEIAPVDIIPDAPKHYRYLRHKYELIAFYICAGFNVGVDEMNSKKRHPLIVKCREMVTALCRETTTLSYPDIAKHMGGRNHSTVITAHQRHMKRQLWLPDRLVYWHGKDQTVAEVMRQVREKIGAVQ